MPNGIPTYTNKGHCTVEQYQHVSGLVVDIDYWVAQSAPTPDVPSPDPLDVFPWDQDVWVIADVTLSGPGVAHFCGSLCIDVDVDTCGPAADMQFEEQSVEIDGSGFHRVAINLPAGTFAPPADFPARCGRVYRICVTVGSLDQKGRPGLIWAHCDSLEIAVHPPVR